ncbi:MAG: hypothetical protein SFU98_11520 [Leptospiraceae bacterium]|nr:hypothetical protein [Leptospiraceae bacterium]
MSEKIKESIPCPECNREKYFEGLCYWCKNRKLREYYQNLSSTEIEIMKDKIIATIDTIDEWEETYKDFMGLVAYQDYSTQEISTIAFQKRKFYPNLLYKNVSNDIENRLFELIENPNCENVSHILRCLAILGNDRVLEVFFQLDKNPLPWRKELYVDLSLYAEFGGWTYDEKRNRLGLIFNECYSLEKDDRIDDSVIVGSLRSDHCPNCGCTLVDILTIDGLDHRLSFLGISGKIKIPICPSCASMCEKTIIRYAINSDSSMEILNYFGEKNYATKEDLEKMETNQLKLSVIKRPLHYSSGNDEVCTLGGNPNWIQDPQYENCPDCSKKMKLLAALSWSQIWDKIDGTLYLEICKECSIIAAFHQQT